MFDFAQDSMMPESTQSWLTAINGHSLMENGTMTSLIKANGQCVERVTRIGEQADFYRNLNSPGFYSCKQRKGANRGKVSGYANIFVVSNPSFVVSLAGRRRTLRERKRCVHAYVRGNVLGAFNGSLDLSKLKRVYTVTYQPFVRDVFFERNVGIKVHELPQSPVALLFGANVYLVPE
ncbi:MULTISPECIES: hypothetical protein [Alteromonadaceae]|uniref:Uncharacterized protein n=1 Tax=Paraglaciecola chathamensis TaxID=368405 RepID=A0A8H9IE10_9ALTE|nr:MULTISPECIES: hypothetical protein [Alteromonadaceae]MAG77280.1 hypothetical protein [Colwelliaceae bacterium]MBC6987400.1 hypothetical protein [Alteromonas sp. BZK5]MCG7643738.1 hypothetical protein [Alteromonas sp. MmMcT2-2]MCG7651753.1 hypothetical protein [Alteromonas sp. MmMcT2-5]GGZ83033.1 hypothetical protein GCM10011274_45810 [Paraglaciecola oceanifecundans]|tara:strand:- start:1203 stop:1736 length:534 start_codon:yes stop_codon:yes gene_type:complete